MALRPRTVKAGSLAAIAVPSVLGSTLVAPASAFAPVVQDIPGAATATTAPKPLFTSTVQPTLSQVSVQIRQQAEQAKQTQQIPATTAVHRAVLRIGPAPSITSDTPATRTGWLMEAFRVASHPQADRP